MDDYKWDDDRVLEDMKKYDYLLISAVLAISSFAPIHNFEAISKVLEKNTPKVYVGKYTIDGSEASKILKLDSCDPVLYLWKKGQLIKYPESNTYSFDGSDVVKWVLKQLP